jgi:hypothetical protein
MKTIKILIAFLVIFLGMKYSNAQNGSFIVDSENTTINIYDLYETGMSLYADTIIIAYNITSVNLQMGNIDYCPPNQYCPDYYVWSFTGGNDFLYYFTINCQRDNPHGQLIQNNKGYYEIGNVTDIEKEITFMCSP